LDLEFTIEGHQPVEILDVSAHEAADVTMREFEHGVVLATPSAKAYRFDLQKLFPGQKFRRLTGTQGEDLETNSGEMVKGPLTLEARDALFLLKE
jgi:hypothetical protein